MRVFFSAYLSAVPFLAAAIGFGLGGVPDRITIPVWLLHSLVMFFMFSRLLNNSQRREQSMHYAATLLFIPWVLFTLFAGFGPPPESAAVWLESVTQQQVRYFILAIGAVITTAGFAVLSTYLENSGQRALGRTAVILLAVATPLYVINMLYWGFYLPRAFASFDSSDINNRPAWYTAIRELFSWLGSFSTACFYLATALFALALLRSARPGKKTFITYIAISIVAAVFCFIPGSFPAPLNIIGYFVSVPAICFIIPYLIGISLVSGSGSK